MCKVGVGLEIGYGCYVLICWGNIVEEVFVYHPFTSVQISILILFVPTGLSRKFSRIVNTLQTLAFRVSMIQLINLMASSVVSIELASSVYNGKSLSTGSIL